MTSLPILKNWKKDDYNLILVIVDKLTKIIYYKLVKTIINIVKLVNLIIRIFIKYYSLLNSILSNNSL